MSETMSEELTARIAALTTRIALLTDALQTSLRLIDALLTEMRLANVRPSHGLLISKMTFDQAMLKVLDKSPDPSSDTPTEP